MFDGISPLRHAHVPAATIWGTISPSRQRVGRIFLIKQSNFLFIEINLNEID